MRRESNSVEYHVSRCHHYPRVEGRLKEGVGSENGKQENEESAGVNWKDNIERQILGKYKGKVKRGI